jgi:hypothetical protein
MILQSKLYQIGEGAVISVYGAGTDPCIALTLYYPEIDDAPEVKNFEVRELPELKRLLDESMASVGFKPVTEHKPVRLDLNSHTPAIVYEVEYDKSLANWFKTIPCCKYDNTLLYFDGWELWDFTTGEVTHEYVEWNTAGNYGEEPDDDWMYEEYGDDIAGPDGMVYVCDGVWMHRDHIGI